ncbi:MAG TPA: hypothetical protein VNH84_09130 [Candidatus Saccharimonadales bacterium]|nr:hypothetical protein [Candidatus Saccharimonadales bacterium]
MNLLKLVCLAIFDLARQVWLLPQTITNAAKERRRQVVRQEHEVERLDRIRHPWKYLGK